jgi:hypothetical protein
VFLGLLRGDVLKLVDWSVSAAASTATTKKT